MDGPAAYLWALGRVRVSHSEHYETPVLRARVRGVFYQPPDVRISSRPPGVGRFERRVRPARGTHRAVAREVRVGGRDAWIEYLATPWSEQSEPSRERRAEPKGTLQRFRVGA